MENNYLISVIVPVHNTVNYLRKCIESIRNQSLENIEIILVDNLSTDGSSEVCDEYASMDTRVKVIHLSVANASVARNAGIDVASAPYIGFIDSDDYIDANMYEELLAAISSYGVDLVYSNFQIEHDDGHIDSFEPNSGMICERSSKEVVYDMMCDRLNSSCCTKLFKKTLFSSLKFPTHNMYEDRLILHQWILESEKVVWIDKAFYHYVKRKKVSITGEKISTKLFTLQKWGEEAYNQVLSYGEEYRDAAEKILYNSLVHILRNFMRDYKELLLENGEFDEEIHDVVSRLINLLLKAKNVKKFRKLDEVLEILNELIARDVLKKDKLPTIEIPCVGILWNSLNEEMMNEAVKLISEKSVIYNCVEIDLKEKYRQFIEDIYVHNHEFEGIPVIKASTLIDKYDSNTIMILNLVIKVSNYIYFNKQKGYMLEEIAELKSFIRKYFKQKIKDYAYDNIFHLTVDDDEYEYTDKICKKYIKDYKREGTNNEQQ